MQTSRCLRPASAVPSYQPQPRRLSSYVCRPVRLLVPGPLRGQTTKFLCSAGVAHPGEEANIGQFKGQFDPKMSVPNVFAAKGGGGGQNFGSGGSLGAVMERSRLEFVMPTPPAVAPKLDDGGSGGDIGKNIHNGGGGGDGDGGDDDDYFNEDGDGDGEGDGEGGDAFFRTLIPESYDKFSIGAVFAEWMRTVAELPLILRRAVEMGLFSSAQLVRFFSMDVRPNLTRSVSRSLPPAWAREFVGRLMADPAFVQKLFIESFIAAASSLYYEYRARGPERFKEELDLVLINTLGMAAATSATVWMVAPTRSYGNVHKFPWQQMLDNLPNCVFDANGPLRTYTPQSRIAAFFSKAAELSAVGLLTGAGTSLLSSAAVALRRKYADPDFEPSVPVPDVARSSAGLAAFFSLAANTRYQLLGGMDRYLLGHSNFMWTYLALSGTARLVSSQLGETHRALCQGLPDPSSLPKRRVVKRKVMVRKKVLKPQQPVQVVEPVVAAAAPVVAEPAMTTSGQVAAAAAEGAAVQVASTSGRLAEVEQVSSQLLPAQRQAGQQEEDVVVLDQVLSAAAVPSSSGSASSGEVLVLHTQPLQAHPSTSSSSSDAATPSSSAPSSSLPSSSYALSTSSSSSPELHAPAEAAAAAPASDLASLVAQQSSASLDAAAMAATERAMAAAIAASSAGQLVGAGPR
ncbi:hypothetical protein Agub_g8288 [Astrephomene gubernaculifera]|uniref:Uncharacterized protein n=1 Tax=Astrephomene gubernaculifera TaxID=47775 RepID=A0AAD3DU47_9CHLO|nr:hypothetical protein Agub_g8288 [Astrephomene gubernaculifera]